MTKNQAKLLRMKIETKRKTSKGVFFELGSIVMFFPECMNDKKRERERK